MRASFTVLANLANFAMSARSLASNSSGVLPTGSLPGGLEALDQVRRLELSSG
jgi:hypothetical protein